MLHLATVVELPWAALALFGLGCGPGTWLHRRSRLPTWAWLPLVAVTACLASYLLFFVSFFSPSAGRLGVRSYWMVSVAIFVWCCRDADTRERLRERDAWMPVVLTVVLTGAFLASAFAMPVTINDRFRFPLPADNLFPMIFAQHLSNGLYGIGVPPHPLDSEWLTSDRPPLQAAITLAAFSVHKGDRQVFYQFASTICQIGWVGALYALVRTMGLRRRQGRIVLLAMASSVFFFLNSIFTWPKLLSAWLFLFALTLILYMVRERGRVSYWILPIAAAAATLALLAHTGVGFSVLALPWLAICWRPWRVVSMRSAIVAAIVAIGLMGPWLAYQRFYDPPGNRLFKMHFAGVPDIDARGTGQALLDAYRGLTLEEYLHGRWANVQQQWFGTYPLPLESWIDWVQWQQILRHVPLVGFLCVGYVLLFMRPASPALLDEPLRLTRQLSWFALITMGIWIVVMIVPASALIHQGSYAMTALLLFCGAVFVAAMPLVIRWTVLALHLLLFASCYLFSTRVAVSSVGPSHPGAFIVAMLLFGIFVWLLHLLPEEN
jgi:hypothetical protein